MPVQASSALFNNPNIQSPVRQAPALPTTCPHISGREVSSQPTAPRNKPLPTKFSAPPPPPQQSNVSAGTILYDKNNKSSTLITNLAILADKTKKYDEALKKQAPGNCAKKINHFFDMADILNKAIEDLRRTPGNTFKILELLEEINNIKIPKNLAPGAGQELSNSARTMAKLLQTILAKIIEKYRSTNGVDELMPPTAKLKEPKLKEPGTKNGANQEKTKLTNRLNELASELDKEIKRFSELCEQHAKNNKGLVSWFKWQLDVGNRRSDWQKQSKDHHEKVAKYQHTIQELTKQLLVSQK